MSVERIATTPPFPPDIERAIAEVLRFFGKATRRANEAAPHSEVAESASGARVETAPLTMAPGTNGAAPAAPADMPPKSVGQQLLDAIKQVKATLAAPTEPLMVAPAPPTGEPLPASPFDIEAAMFAVEHATTLDQAMSAVKAFADGAETMVKAAADPFAALTTMFGVEAVTTVTAASAAAVVALEVEAAATGGTITDRAASRVARTMVHQVTMRAGRTMPRPPRARGGRRVRILRGPRARRAHRRAVRLSAVASAGDGPPPGEPPAGTRAPHGVRLSLAGARISSARPTDVAHVSHTANRAVEATP